MRCVDGLKIFLFEQLNLMSACSRTANTCKYQLARLLSQTKLVLLLQNHISLLLSHPDASLLLASKKFSVCILTAEQRAELAQRESFDSGVRHELKFHVDEGERMKMNNMYCCGRNADILLLVCHKMRN